MRHLESKIQQACVRWFRYQYPKHLIFAIPNGGARSEVTGKILKAEGVLAGVPDLFIAVSSSIYAGLFIEMKTERGKTSPAQQDIQENLFAAGYRVVTCRSTDEFIATVENYMCQLKKK